MGKRLLQQISSSYHLRRCDKVVVVVIHGGELEASTARYTVRSRFDIPVRVS